MSCSLLKEVERRCSPRAGRRGVRSPCEEGNARNRLIRSSAARAKSEARADGAATQRLAIQPEIQIPAFSKALPRSTGHRGGHARILVPGIIARWDCAPGTSGFCAFIMIGRSFFVRGAATIAIEPDALEAAR